MLPAVFHLGNIQGGGKMILREHLGGPRDCTYMHSSALCGGVWGHNPLEKFLIFRPSEITSGAFFRPFVVSNDMMR